MDDVDYLVEDNAMDDFCFSPEMNGTHDRTTFEDDPGQQLLRRQPMENWHNGSASWEQNATVGNVPTITSAWDSDPVGDRILQTQHVWRESLQHNSTRWRCEILEEWTKIASSKSWAGSATYKWTHCPRQAWPRSSLIIKHYRVQVGHHQRGYRSLAHELVFAQQLLFREQINPWLGVLGNTYGLKVASLQTIEYFAHMHDWLGMVPKDAKTSFLEFTAATYIKCTWIRGSHSFHPNVYLMSGIWRQCLQSFQY